MRETYLNGDPIELQECGCDGCQPAMINGVLCHETGCPYAWKDCERECSECGCDFHPTDRYNRVCDDCLLAYEDGNKARRIAEEAGIIEAR